MNQLRIVPTENPTVLEINPALEKQEVSCPSSNVPRISLSQLSVPPSTQASSGIIPERIKSRFPDTGYGKLQVISPRAWASPIVLFILQFLRKEPQKSSTGAEFLTVGNANFPLGESTLWWWKCDLWPNRSISGGTLFLNWAQP